MAPSTRSQGRCVLLGLLIGSYGRYVPKRERKEATMTALSRVWPPGG